MRALVAVGTRPEAIKLAPVILEGRSRGHDVVLVTGLQHPDVLEATLAEFSLSPAVGIPRSARSSRKISDVVAETMLIAVEAIRANRPDAIVVQGDTATALGFAQAGFFDGLPVVHVEAGLRSGDLGSPFPEEANRRAIAVFTTFHMAPTEQARDQLAREGVPPSLVTVTGNTVVDAMAWVLRGPHRWSNAELAALADGRKLVLVTVHRRESWGAGVAEVGEAILRLAESRADVHVVFPVHPNPKMREWLPAALWAHPRILATSPLTYRDTIQLMQACSVVVTDSGGLQEEAPSLGRPVVVTRDTTERPEAVRAGYATLVGTDITRIIEAISAALGRPALPPCGVFGDGRASERIWSVLERHMSNSAEPGRLLTSPVGGLQRDVR